MSNCNYFVRKEHTHTHTYAGVLPYNQITHLPPIKELTQWSCIRIEVLLLYIGGYRVWAGELHNYYMPDVPPRECPLWSPPPLGPHVKDALTETHTHTHWHGKLKKTFALQFWKHCATTWCSSCSSCILRIWLGCSKILHDVWAFPQNSMFCMRLFVCIFAQKKISRMNICTLVTKRAREKCRVF